jgi:hypothetical protein
VEYATGQLPEAITIAGSPYVIGYGLSRRIYHLAGYSRVGHWHSYPFFLGLSSGFGCFPLEATVSRRLGNLFA